MVINPDWYDSRQIPGTKIFQLANAATIRPPEEYTAVSSENCNQKSRMDTYRLEPITIEQLQQYTLVATTCRLPNDNNLRDNYGARLPRREKDIADAKQNIQSNNKDDYIKYIKYKNKYLQLKNKKLLE